MTYKEVRQKQKALSVIEEQIRTTREHAEDISQSYGNTTVSSSTHHSRIEIAATDIVYLTGKRDKLHREISAALDSLPDTLEGNCLILKVRCRYTWKRIAAVIDESEDAIKRKCERYWW